MFYIQKYVDGWAIHDDDTGESRKLTEKEVKAVQEEFPSLQDAQVRSVFADEIRSVTLKPAVVRPVQRKHRRKR